MRHQAVLGLGVLPLVGIGLWSLVDPAGVVSGIGVDASSTAGQVEIRAMYGGLEVGVGIALSWLAWSRRIEAGYILCLGVYGGLFAGRLPSLVLAGAWDTLHPVLAGAEGMATVMAAVGLFLFRRG